MAQSTPFELQLVTPAEDVFDFFRRNCKLFPLIVRDPNNGLIRQDIVEVKLLQGAWESVGSQRLWTFGGCYAHWGSWKDNVESQQVVFKGAMSITFTLLEGSVLKGFKSLSLKTTCSFTPGKKGCTVEGTVIFEKQNPNVPDPTELLDFLQRMVEAVDAFFQGKY